MRAAAGYSALAIGAAAAFYGISSIGFGLHTGRPPLVRFGRRCAYVTLAAAVAAFAVMEWALFARDFSIEYVAENVARATPGLYTFTAAWAALEGSILLWILALTGYVAFTTWRFRDRAGDPLVAWATIVALGVTLFFFVLTLGPANPFREVAGAVPGDGRGPNALLQNHPLVAFHPPALYLGYVGFTVPFSFAVAALVTGRFGEGWLADVRRTTVVAWGFLTVGIVLGMWWSYEVLGWGGYWGWDPVENASLLPWLTGTAFIHSVMVQERRGMLRVWNLSLVLATFCLTILGTFLTRSGVVTSVHAFSQSDIGPWLLAFLGVAAFGSVALVAWRADRLRTPARIDSPVSREAAFLLNNLLFGGFALVVLTGTVFPLLAEALDDRQLSVGEPYFERMGTPIGIALLFLMAVGPQLPWRAASGEVLRRRLLVPAWAGGLTLVAAVAAGARGVAQVVTFALAAFALASIGRSVVVGVRTRRRAHAESPPVAFGRMVRANPRLYGGLTVHVGVIVAAVAIAASSGYVTERELRLGVGESAEVRGYTLTYLGTEREATGQKATVKARVAIARGDDDLGTYAPALSTFPNTRAAIGTPSVRTGLLEDVYLTLVSSPDEGGAVTLGVEVNPMVVWLWVGGALMALGTAVALLPGARRRSSRRAPAGRPARDAEPDRALVEVPT
ncbi:MAG: cytochrome c biogenesis protein CcmF [Acidimicrobiia bacterium]|nr:MAG: cytochrome c biogenesis protein CcmF [Acidimicrobiia bacterium]